MKDVTFYMNVLTTKEFTKPTYLNSDLPSSIVSNVEAIPGGLTRRQVKISKRVNEPQKKLVPHRNSRSY